VTEWLSYDTTIDGANALVDVDAAFDDARERPQYATAIEVTVTGFAVDADKLPTEDADDALFAVEQKLEDVLDEGDGVLAATVASAGAYRFIAYAANGSLQERLAEAVRAAGMQASATTSSDPTWSAYGRWSLSGDALEEARDRAQIEELESVGDDLSAEHELTFDYEFEDEESARAGADAFGEAGFETEEPIDTFVQVPVRLVPTAEAVKAARVRMNAIAALCGGAYAGWGCEPIGGE
jgi:hypothetical protein